MSKKVVGIWILAVLVLGFALVQVAEMESQKQLSPETTREFLGAITRGNSFEYPWQNGSMSVNFDNQKVLTWSENCYQDSFTFSTANQNFSVDLICDGKPFLVFYEEATSSIQVFEIRYQ